MPTRRSDSEKTEYIRLSPTQMGIYVAVFIGGIAFASTLNWGSNAVKIRALQEKYDKLKTDYDNLKQDYETETDQKYWKEYTLHRGDVVVDPRLNCSIEIRFIYESLESASIRLSKYGEEDKSESILLHKAAPYDLTGEGDFFVIAKEFGDDSFTMIITEK